MKDHAAKQAFYTTLSHEIEKCHAKGFPDFYGKLTFSFEKGKISVIRKEETMKPIRHTEVWQTETLPFPKFTGKIKNY